MAYENFLVDYAEVDGGDDVARATNKVSWVNLPRNVHSYVYRNMGLDHFSGDFEHQFEIKWTARSGTGIAAWWAIYDGIGSLAQQSGNGYALYLQDTNIVLATVEGGSTIDTESWTSTINTLYFITIVRDDNGGVNSTGQITAYIRTGSHAGNLEATLTVDNSAGEQNDMQYVYALSSYNDGNASTWSGYIENLDLGEAEPALLEQEGFRWRNDNGNEAGATYRQNQDVNDSVAIQTNIRLRFLVDASGDPDPEQFKLQYKKKVDEDWLDMPLPE